MFKEGPRYKNSPAKAGGEGWLVNDQQQKVVRFRDDMEPRLARCAPEREAS